MENLYLEHQGDLEVYERLYLSQLEKRYEISRSTLTNRMNRLGLVTGDRIWLQIFKSAFA
ncbi:MAG TPA: hypothetical protein V6D12_08920 [Candidatus Obscuribacterales bacterium]